MAAKITNRPSKKSKTKIILLSYALVVAILFAWIYLLPNVSEAFRKTDILNYGGIQTKDTITCYLVRTETVYNANNAGQIQYFASEGDQLRAGSKVLAIASDSIAYNAEKRGMLSYFTDGQEGFFNPETMKTLDKETVNKLEIEVKNISRETASIGEPIYKIVNSDEWYIVTWIKKETIIKYEKGRKVHINFESGSVAGSIDDIIKSNDDFMVILKFDHYSPEMAKLRKVTAEIVIADYKGLLVANESIKTIGDKTGVYVKNVSGNFVFKPVKIITSDGTYSLVESAFFYETQGNESKKIETVDVYDEILKNGKPN